MLSAHLLPYKIKPLPSKEIVIQLPCSASIKHFLEELLQSFGLTLTCNPLGEMWGISSLLSLNGCFLLKGIFRKISLLLELHFYFEMFADWFPHLTLLGRNN